MRLMEAESQIKNEPKISGSPAEIRSMPYKWHRRYAIPLACPPAYRFYLDYLALPHSISEVFWTALSRKWPRAGRTMLLTKRYKNGYAWLQESRKNFAVTASPESQRLDHKLRLHLRKSGLGSPGFLTPLILNDHENLRRGQTVAFLFDDSSKLPLAVAKLSTDPRQCSALQHEYQTLRHLTRYFEKEQPARIPQPLAFFESPPWSVVLESHLPGPTAYFEMRNRWNALQHVPEHFRMALEWLITFHKAAGIRNANLNQSMVLDYVVKPLQQLAAQGCRSAAELQLIKNTADLAEQLIGENLFLVARHGDFWAGNIVLHNGFASVIDWEHFEPEALSFDDLFFFSTTYGLNYPWKLACWAAPEAAFQATYLQATEVAHLVRDYLLNYCRLMDLVPELLDVFFPAFLAKRALMQTSSGTGSADIWRKFFRIYAERNKPACFSDRAVGMEITG